MDGIGYFLGTLVVFGAERKVEEVGAMELFADIPVGGCGAF